MPAKNKNQHNNSYKYRGHGPLLQCTIYNWNAGDFIMALQKYNNHSKAPWA
jgi:hypothetical protein